MATSEAQKRATKKHLQENYTELRFRVRKNEAIAIKERAKAQGLSFRAYMLKLIQGDINK